MIEVVLKGNSRAEFLDELRYVYECFVGDQLNAAVDEMSFQELVDLTTLKASAEGWELVLTSKEDMKQVATTKPAKASKSAPVQVKELVEPDTSDSKPEVELDVEELKKMTIATMQEMFKDPAKEAIVNDLRERFAGGKAFARVPASKFVEIAAALEEANNGAR